MDANSSNSVQDLQLSHPPRRVVSLVPSLTESLFDLGFGEAVVGITDYCVHPEQAVAGLPRLGGTKNPRLDDILALNPDLVLANWEENTRQTVEALRAHGVAVWVSHPQTVQQAMDVLWQLVALFPGQGPAATLQLKSLATNLDWVRSAAASQPGLRYFCPIWHEKTGEGQPWWMTFNRHTYCHDLLAQFGGENAFAGRQRRYPLAADLGQGEAQDAGQRDTRYPRLTLEEIIAAAPEMILLTDEPYAFNEEHRQEIFELLAGTPAVQNRLVHLVDGSLITWHGTRLGRALSELPPLFAA